MKTTKVTALFLLLALLLTGCAGRGGEEREKESAAETQLEASFSAADTAGEEAWEGEPIPLRMLSLSASPNIIKAVDDFNRQSRKYRIELESFFPYEKNPSSAEWDGAFQRLNTMLASGDVPDILDLYELPAELYYKKGLIVDLFPYLKSDPGIRMEDYFAGAFEAMSTDGVLPFLTNGIGLGTMIGARELAGSEPGWTLEEMNAMLDDKGLSALYMSGNGLLTAMLWTHRSFVDWETGQAQFETEEFIQILELAKRLRNNEVSGAVTMGEYEPHYVSYEFIMDFCRMAQLLDYYQGDLELLGFPTDSGEYHVVSAEMRLAISAACEDKAGAWSFVRTLLTEQQDSCLMFPLSRAAFARAAQTAMVGDGSYPAAQYYPSHIQVEREDVELVEALIERARYPFSKGDTIVELVLEEAKKFFNGYEDAYEAARQLQSRVTLYLAEQM